MNSVLGRAWQHPIGGSLGNANRKVLERCSSQSYRVKADVRVRRKGTGLR